MAGTFWYNATVLLSDPICFHTCLLVCSQLVSLFLYLHCDSSLWALSVKGISLSPVSRFSLHCSVFFVLVAFGIGLKSHLFWYSSLLHSHMWLFSLGASGAQYAPCPLSVSVLVPLVLYNSCPYCSPSLSLLFFSLGASLDTWFSPVPHLSSLVLVCSLQHVSLIPSSLLLLLGKERISWPLVFLLNFSSFVQVTFPYPRSLPHVTLLTFLLVSNLSPYPLSTTVLLSRSPAFGTERIVFLLFPFFPSLSL